MALDDTLGEFVTYVYYLCHTFSLRLLPYVHPLGKHQIDPGCRHKAPRPRPAVTELISIKFVVCICLTSVDDALAPTGGR